MMLGLNMIGNMHSYLKTMERQSLWERKKASGDITAKKDPIVEMLQKQVDDMHGKNGGPDRVKLSEIHTKLQAGAELTPDERKYLQENDPEAYKELVKEEQEQKAYERALRRCKTQQDVERLKTMQLGKSLTTIKSVENNPNIPLQKKLEIAMREQRKVNNVMESTNNFVKSGEYSKLPTEEEYEEAMKEAMEKLHPTVEPEQTEEVKEPEESTETENKDQTQDIAQDKVEVPKKPDGTEPEKVKKPQKTDTIALQEPKIDIESDAERKVRRARAKAAYVTVQEPVNTEPSFTERA